MRLGHLTKRFFASLWPLGPSPEKQEWVRSVLSDNEQGPLNEQGINVTTPVLAAALLHDVGKVTAGLGTYGRVVATLAGAAAGRSMADAWTEGKGFTRRVGLYLRHGALGADMLAMAGSDPLTVTWAREHHLPEEEWTLPKDIAHALKAADND